MAKVLEVAGLEPEELQSVIVALKSALHIEGPRLQLEAANSLWCNNRWAPRPNMWLEPRKTTTPEVTMLDFGGAEAVASINSWVSTKLGAEIGRHSELA